MFSGVDGLMLGGRRVGLSRALLFISTGVKYVCKLVGLTPSSMRLLVGLLAGWLLSYGRSERLALPPSVDHRLPDDLWPAQLLLEVAVLKRLKDFWRGW